MGGCKFSRKCMYPKGCTKNCSSMSNLPTDALNEGWDPIESSYSVLRDSGIEELKVNWSGGLLLEITILKDEIGSFLPMKLVLNTWKQPLCKVIHKCVGVVHHHGLILSKDL
ncbi:hypothetical protein MKX03_013012 [Papaver bracteatum]|nr:hypothetical protein MKX03_013012 [Papaver bracteatum]